MTETPDIIAAAREWAKARNGSKSYSDVCDRLEKALAALPADAVVCKASVLIMAADRLRICRGPATPESSLEYSLRQAAGSER